MTHNPNEITTAKILRLILKKAADPKKAINCQRFFKTGKGEYAEGDVFLGITVPELRSLVKKCHSIPLNEIKSSLSSPLHEERMAALFLLVDKFKKGDTGDRATIYRLYLSSTRYINNWDLVDCSAHLIVGAHLEDKDTKVLFDLAKSIVLWERRIAVIATLHFIRKDRFDLPLELFSILLNDKEDLIHKAVGWMLREIGKRDFAAEEGFLKTHHKRMPRTMLRYAIERFPEEKRVLYLKGKKL